MFFIRKMRGLNNVHRTFYTGGDSKISSDFVAGPYSYVGPDCIIYEGVQIGSYTMIANNVSIIGGDHIFNRVGIPIIFSGRAEFKPTYIGADVWIGAHSIIITGVNIGNGAIIAAGSVITRDVEPYSIVGGVPGKKIRNRFNESEITVHEEMLKKNYKSSGFGVKKLVN